MAESKDLERRGAGLKHQKLNYINNLRSSLTALVIVHHTATSYGGIGRNVYQASQFGQAASAALTGFNAINHSFFMSTFMYLAGHFSEKTLRRKSKGQFVRDRLYRLGLPTIAYTVIGAPICLAVRDSWKGRTVGWPFLFDHWKSIRQVAGPVWFTATLLAFDLTMVAAHSLKELLGMSRPSPVMDKGEDEDRRVRSLPLLATLGMCSAAEFFVRLVYPVGAVVPPLKLQPGNVAPYIAAYVFGAYNQNVEDVGPNSVGTSICLAVAAASGILLPSALMSGETCMGGWNKAAASFAIWGNFTGYLIGSTLLTAFSRTSSASWEWINQYSYPAFLVHMPVLTILGVTTDKWQSSPVHKTAVIGGASVVLSWVGGYVVAELWALLRRISPRSPPSEAR